MVGNLDVEVADALIGEGVDRLLAVVGEEARREAPADAIVLYLDDSLLGHYHAIAEEIRRAGLRCEVYPENRKLPQQFKFAEKKGIPAAVICGPDEAAEKVMNVKNLQSRESFDRLALPEAVRRVREIAGGLGDGAPAAPDSPPAPEAR